MIGPQQILAIVGIVLVFTTTYFGYKARSIYAKFWKWHVAGFYISLVLMVAIAMIIKEKALEP